MLARTHSIVIGETYPHPYTTMDKVQTVNPTSNKTANETNKRKTSKTSQNHTVTPTFDIPFGSSNTSAKRTSPAA